MRKRAKASVRRLVCNSGLKEFRSHQPSHNKRNRRPPQGLEPASLFGLGGTLRRASLAQGRLRTEVVPFPKPFTR